MTISRVGMRPIVMDVKYQTDMMKNNGTGLQQYSANSSKIISDCRGLGKYKVKRCCDLVKRNKYNGKTPPYCKEFDADKCCATKSAMKPKSKKPTDKPSKLVLSRLENARKKLRKVSNKRASASMKLSNTQVNSKTKPKSKMSAKAISKPKSNKPAAKAITSRKTPTTKAIKANNLKIARAALKSVKRSSARSSVKPSSARSSVKPSSARSSVNSRRSSKSSKQFRPNGIVKVLPTSSNLTPSNKNRLSKRFKSKTPLMSTSSSGNNTLTTVSSTNTSGVNTNNGSSDNELIQLDTSGATYNNLRDRLNAIRTSKTGMNKETAKYLKMVRLSRENLNNLCDQWKIYMNGKEMPAQLKKYCCK